MRIPNEPCMADSAFADRQPPLRVLFAHVKDWHWGPQWLSVLQHASGQQRDYILVTGAIEERYWASAAALFAQN